MPPYAGTGRYIEQTQVENLGDRCIIASPGATAPNWVDFSGPLGLAAAYEMEVVVQMAIEASIASGRTRDSVEYLQTEWESHTRILQLIKQVATVRATTLPVISVDRKDEDQLLSALIDARNLVVWPSRSRGAARAAGDMSVSPLHAAAGSLEKRKSDLPYITDPPFYTPG